MKPIKYLFSLLLIQTCLIHVCLNQNTNFLHPKDPRVITETYHSNGRTLQISNYPTLEINGQTRFYDQSRIMDKKAPLRFSKAKAPKYQDVEKDEDKFFCIGNDKPKDAKDRLEKFTRGSCLPIVLVPGIMGTRLRVRITNCDILSSNVRNSCGFLKSLAGRPCVCGETEFDLWISVSNTSPASFSVNERCLGQLAGLNLTAFETSNDENLLSDLPDVEGVQVTWFGNTPGTNKWSKCGVNAIQNLASGTVEGPGTALSESVEGYFGMVSYLEEMGYSAGSTLFAMPYDWRRRAGNTDVALNLERTLDLANKLTNKQAIIVSHSSGSLNVLHHLQKMTPEKKQKLVKRFVPIGPPFAGTFESIKNSITGTKDYTKYQSGIDIKNLRSMFTSHSGHYDLAIKDVFKKEAESPWAQELIKRLQFEEKEFKGSDFWTKNQIPFSWFPNPSKSICNTRRSEEHRYCGLHFYNYFKNPLLTYQMGKGEKKTFNATKEDLTEIIEHFGLRTEQELNFILVTNKTKDYDQVRQKDIWGEKKLIPEGRVKKLFDITYKNEIQNLTNPGVPVTLIYGAIFPTTSTMSINEQSLPRTMTNNDIFFEEDKVTLQKNYGDSFVGADGALTALFKWGWEFDNQQSPHPVQVIEYCSIVDPIFPIPESGKKYTTTYKAPTNNTYNGIPCDGKTHDSLLTDQYIIKLVTSIAKSGTPAEVNPEIAALSAVDIENLEKTCPGLSASADKDPMIYGLDKKNLPDEGTGRFENLENIASTSQELGILKTVAANIPNLKKFPDTGNMPASVFFLTYREKEKESVTATLRMLRANKGEKKKL